MAATQSVNPEMTPWPEVTGTAAMRAPCSGTQIGRIGHRGHGELTKVHAGDLAQPVLERGEFGHEPADVVLGEPGHVRASCTEGAPSFSGSELERSAPASSRTAPVRRGLAPPRRAAAETMSVAHHSRAPGS